MNTDYRIGFDVGGSHVAAGLVRDGKIEKRVEAPFIGNGEALYELMKTLADELTGEGGIKPECIGISVPGSIDRAHERVINAYNLGLHDEPVCERVSRIMGGAEVRMVNDAEAATIAEFAAGVLRDCKCGILLTLGSGVGGCMVVNGKIWRGGLGNGCEPGHMILKQGGEACTCGNHGCAETLCSARSLVSEGIKSAEAMPGSMLAKMMRTGSIDGKRIVQCAHSGDGAAIEAFERYVDYLGSLVASLINIIDPEIIALGGGIGLSGEMLLEPLRENVKQKSFFTDFAKLVSPVFGNDAGIIGAAMIKEYL